jgi:hypothetical protein
MAASTYINAYPMGAALQKLFIEEFGAINENASQFIDNFLDLSGDMVKGSLMLQRIPANDDGISADQIIAVSQQPSAWMIAPAALFGTGTEDVVLQHFWGVPVAK